MCLFDDVHSFPMNIYAHTCINSGWKKKNTNTCNKPDSGGSRLNFWTIRLKCLTAAVSVSQYFINRQFLLIFLDKNESRSIYLFIYLLLIHQQNYKKWKENVKIVNDTTNKQTINSRTISLKRRKSFSFRHLIKIKQHNKMIEKNKWTTTTMEKNI